MITAPKLLESIRDAAAYLQKFSDGGQHRHIQGPLAGTCYDIGNQLLAAADKLAALAPPSGDGVEPVATVATLIHPELADKDSGPFFSAQDWAALRRLPGGTKLYTTPQSAPIAPVDGECDDLDQERAEAIRAAIGQDKPAQAAFDSLLGDLAHQRDDNRRLYRLTTPQSAPVDGGRWDADLAKANSEIIDELREIVGLKGKHGSLIERIRELTTTPAASQERGVAPLPLIAAEYLARERGVASMDWRNGWNECREEMRRIGVKGGVALIATERERQISVEGWTPEHDDEHDEEQLASAAAAYALPARIASGRWRTDGRPFFWPWDQQWWKPKDRIRDLARAGALIAAEIDRLQRAPPPSSAAEGPK